MWETKIPQSCLFFEIVLLAKLPKSPSLITAISTPACVRLGRLNCYFPLNFTVFGCLGAMLPDWDAWDSIATERLELTYPPGGFATSVYVPVLSTLLYCVVVLVLSRRRRGTANWKKAEALPPSAKDERARLRAAAMIAPGSAAERGLKRLQQVHNVALSLFSATMFAGTLHACLTREWRLGGNGVGGLAGAICVEAGSPDHLGEGLRRMFHWYQLSKYWEYLDTLFLVLNGKDLSFLHVYHHGVVSSTRA